MSYEIAVLVLAALVAVLYLMGALMAAAFTGQLRAAVVWPLVVLKGLFKRESE